MNEKTIRFRLHHRSGATDDLLEQPANSAFVPRVGEYVTIGDVIHGYVFDVNYDYGAEGEHARATVCIACKGQRDCDWGCTADHVREWQQNRTGTRR